MASTFDDVPCALKVTDIVVLVDRQSGAKEALTGAGFNLDAILTLTQLLDHWEKTGKVSKEKIAETRDFLTAHG